MEHFNPHRRHRGYSGYQFYHSTAFDGRIAQFPPGSLDQSYNPHSSAIGGFARPDLRGFDNNRYHDPPAQYQGYMYNPQPPALVDNMVIQNHGAASGQYYQPIEHENFAHSRPQHNTYAHPAGIARSGHQSNMYYAPPVVSTGNTTIPDSHTAYGNQRAVPNGKFSPLISPDEIGVTSTKPDVPNRNLPLPTPKRTVKVPTVFPSSPSRLIFGFEKHPTPYSISFNPLLLMQRDLREIEPGKDEEAARLRNYLHNTWNSLILKDNKIFNDRTRCRLCGQCPRVEHSFHEMNHHFSRKASALWKDLQSKLLNTDPATVSLEDMENFYDMYWEVERVFWEDDCSTECGVPTWTGYHA
ncbi:uncharacterized protein LY89DRAFT_724115 [Mollisia scopiformis]|uniref:Uncharacterized protein n=1 Tax=Mollisia scopiformis TaxID=149040 RepID=A0A132BBC7_MOLSC|nr:uncharacterized protein LY89DRAFT_724115 [Mollisia scopiformis]KUJ09696.1 hypothetical protein LY89DRAFT_724115 [Mollisia scopiformis]